MLNVVILLFLRRISGTNKAGEEAKAGSAARIGPSEEYVLDIDHIKLRKKSAFLSLRVSHPLRTFLRLVT